MTNDRFPDDLAGCLDCNPGRPPFTVEAEVDHDAGEPGAKLRQRLPARGMGPDPQHGFLRHVFGVGGIAENAPGERQRRRQMPTRKQPIGRFVAARDPGHERFVAVVHREVAAAMLISPCIVIIRLSD